MIITIATLRKRLSKCIFKSIFIKKNCIVFHDLKLIMLMEVGLILHHYDSTAVAHQFTVNKEWNIKSWCVIQTNYKVSTERSLAEVIF